MKVVGKLLDRLCFWNVPGFIKSYELPVPHETFLHNGIEVWHVPGHEDGPTVLFCHGNAGNLRFPNVRRDRFLALHECGVNLWAFDYRGYGRSEGTPTENGVYEDAVAVHQLARESHQEGRPFVLFGRSLGGAVATYLATEIQSPDLLILESTFTCVSDVVSWWSSPKVAALMNNRFDSGSRFANLTCPVRFIHGTKDGVVPYELGRKLYDGYRGEKEFVTVMGAGHNNLQRRAEGLYEETLYRWLGHFTD